MTLLRWLVPPLVGIVFGLNVGVITSDKPVAPVVNHTASLTPYPPQAGNAGIVSCQVGCPGLSGPLTVEAVPVYLSLETFGQLVRASSWPEELWADVIGIAVCETGADTDFDGVKDAIAVGKRGDSGRAHGPLQVRSDVHTELARAYDLDEPRQNIEAARIVYLKAVIAFGDGFQPWRACR